MSLHVLVADSGLDGPDDLAALCRSCGYRTSSAATAEQALDVARRDGPDVVLLDAGLGKRCLSELVALEDAPVVVMAAGLADLPVAVQALREGALDFLQKPARRDVLEGVLARALRLRAVILERDELRARVSSDLSGPILGNTRPLLRLLEQIRKVATTPRTTVLVLGEPGVGKELVGRAIHEHSARAHAPFVKVSCAAPAESEPNEARLEATLFGHRGGADEDAHVDGRGSGLVAQAEGGTLFLDEVGALGPRIQAQLLRLLQERVYRRVGSDEDERLDVRVIAATNRDLEGLVHQGHFRDDLFYRLNVMTLKVPSLRERGEDVPLLALHFLETFARDFGRQFAGFSDEALRVLAAHPWPGNVRELRNTVERAALLTPGGHIEPGHLTLGSSAPGAVDAHGAPEARITLAPGNYSLRSMEAELIRVVLEQAGGNRSQAARMLGVNRTTLYNKLRQYDI